MEAETDIAATESGLDTHGEDEVPVMRAQHVSDRGEGNTWARCFWLGWSQKWAYGATLLGHVEKRGAGSGKQAARLLGCGGRSTNTT